MALGPLKESRYISILKVITLLKYLGETHGMTRSRQQEAWKYLQPEIILLLPTRVHVLCDNAQ